MKRCREDRKRLWVRRWNGKNSIQVKQTMSVRDKKEYVVYCNEISDEHISGTLGGILEGKQTETGILAARRVGGPM
jgi:hypothetical protein